MSELPVNGKCLVATCTQDFQQWRLHRTLPIRILLQTHSLSSNVSNTFCQLSGSSSRQVSYMFLYHTLIANANPCGSTVISTGSEPSCSRLVVKLKLFKGPPNLQRKTTPTDQKQTNPGGYHPVIFTTWNFNLYHQNFSFLGLKYCWWLKSCIIYLKYMKCL